MRANSACIANWGCPGAAAAPLLSSPAISRQLSSSRSVSSPGSTTAPCGSRAMAAIKSAVAGIDPVEPATITGPSVLRASRAVSALISASRRAIGSIACASRRTSGQRSRAICKNRSVICQNVSNSSGTSSSSRAHGTSRVVMSSMSRARSSARAEAAAGVCATSGVPVAPRTSGVFDHAITRRVSRSLRSSPPSAGGNASASAAMPPPALSAKAISSSSMSPMATMRGRMAPSPRSRSRNASRISRQARRVGR